MTRPSRSGGRSANGEGWRVARGRRHGSDRRTRSAGLLVRTVVESDQAIEIVGVSAARVCRRYMEWWRHVRTIRVDVRDDRVREGTSLR
jgi:hypothetical protein